MSHSHSAFSPASHWMQHALALAQQGWGTTNPNPLVGAVLTNPQGDQLLGEGAHLKAGTPHAECHALAQAGDAAKGATLYVTLEPCCHHGRTGPCTQALIEAGVARVVVACLDANPQVAGQGVAILRQAGIEVSVGCCATEAFLLNRPFFYRMATGRPWVTYKLATTLDGKLATRTGHSQWITSPPARQWVQHQRAAADALVTTAATVLTDNPRLTPRGDERYQQRQRPRLLVDRRLSLLEETAPNDLHVWTSSDAPTLLLYDPASVSPALLRQAAQRKVAVQALRFVDARLDMEAFKHWCYKAGLFSVWVETGPRMAGTWLAHWAANQVQWLLAPRWLGDAAAPSPEAPPPIIHMADAHTRHPEAPVALLPDMAWSLLDDPTWAWQQQALAAQCPTQ